MINMKNFIPFLVLLLGIRGYSQCVKTQISTDPDNPINSERSSMLNTFDWTQEWFDLYCDNINDNQIQSPFYQPNNVNINHLKESKDRLPKDGWELIHYDLGFNLSSGSVDYPYLVLYNRYTGTMRVFVAIARVNDHSAAQFKVYFLSDNKTHLLSTGNTLLPIDNLIADNPSLASPAPFLNSDKMWFYADFTMMYDPCTCETNSKLVIKVDLIDYAQVDIQGESTGSLVAIDDKIGTVKDDASAAFDPKDLAKSWKKGQKTYKDISKFVKDQEKALKIEGKTDFELEVEGLYNKLNKRHSLNDFQEAIKSSKFLKTGLKAAPYIGAATALVDLFVGGGQESTGPQEVKLTPTSINLNSSYKGTITTDYPYKTIIFSTPGTNESNILDDDEYPFYNHSLGVFNLLETPEVGYYKQYYEGGALPDELGGVIYWDGVFKYYLKPTKNLKYVINPAAGFKPNPEVLFSFFIELKGGFDDILFLDNNFENRSDIDGLIIEEDDTTYRTMYLPTGAFTQIIPKFDITDFCIFRSHPEWEGNPVKNVYLKVLVNLERLDADENTQNVLFVGKYPINLNRRYDDPSSSYWNSNLTIMNRSIYKKDETLTQSLQAWDKITLENVQVEPTSNLDIIAYNEISLLPGTSLKPGTTIKTGFPNGAQYGSLPPVSHSSIDCSNYKSAVLKSANISKKNIEINEVTIVEENKLNDVSVFPNPMTNYTGISSNIVLINKIKILNSIGSTIEQYENLNSNSVQINTSDFKQGLYVFQIHLMNGKTICSKILKQ